MLNKMAVLENHERSQAATFGLTLVAGLPLPDALCGVAARAQETLEQIAPGDFFWYARPHTHMTVYAPLRGRYREAPPLQRHELPADPDQLTVEISAFCTA